MERDISGQWLFKMRSAGSVVSPRLTDQEFDESSGRIGFMFRGAFMNGSCRRYSGQQLPTQAAYQPVRPRRVGVGTQWSFEGGDELTGKKWVADNVVTEQATGSR